MIIEAAILCVEQEFTLRGHRDHAKSASDDDCDNMKKVHQGNFLAIVNTFAKFDTILKENIEQGFRNAEFLSWDMIKMTSLVVKEHISESTYYATQMK